MITKLILQSFRDDSGADTLFFSSEAITNDQPEIKHICPIRCRKCTAVYTIYSHNIYGCKSVRPRRRIFVALQLWGFSFISVFLKSSNQGFMDGWCYELSRCKALSEQFAISGYMKNVLDLLMYPFKPSRNKAAPSKCLLSIATSEEAKRELGASFARLSK